MDSVIILAVRLPIEKPDGLITLDILTSSKPSILLCAPSGRCTPIFQIVDQVQLSYPDIFE